MSLGRGSSCFTDSTCQLRDLLDQCHQSNDLRLMLHVLEGPKILNAQNDKIFILDLEQRLPVLQLPEPYQCKGCGFFLESDSGFCRKCGEPREGDMCRAAINC